MQPSRDEDSGQAKSSTLSPPDTGMVRMSASEQAALYIRKLIFGGQLRPGNRVPQDEIARNLGMSRIPIREALIALAREGWVTIEMNRGAFINALDAQAVHDTYELFGIIYGFAARRAVTRGVTDLGPRLTDLAKRMSTTDDPATLGRLTIQFHASIVEAAGSPRINVLLRAMSGMLPGEFFALVPSAIELEKRGLVAIARAMKNGDAERAAQQYARMMNRVGDQVVQVFEDHGLFDSKLED
jgi:DNA-binding GntR family transcriptional regulator